jgi:hypothetical protein
MQIFIYEQCGCGCAKSKVNAAIERFSFFDLDYSISRISIKKTANKKFSTVFFNSSLCFFIILQIKFKQ